MTSHNGQESRKNFYLATEAAATLSGATDSPLQALRQEALGSDGNLARPMNIAELADGCRALAEVLQGYVRVGGARGGSREGLRQDLLTVAQARVGSLPPTIDWALLRNIQDRLRPDSPLEAQGMQRVRSLLVDLLLQPRPSLPA